MAKLTEKAPAADAGTTQMSNSDKLAILQRRRRQAQIDLDGCRQELETYGPLIDQQQREFDQALADVQLIKGQIQTALNDMANGDWTSYSPIWLRQHSYKAAVRLKAAQYNLAACQQYRQKLEEAIASINKALPVLDARIAELEQLVQDDQTASAC